MSSSQEFLSIKRSTLRYSLYGRRIFLRQSTLKMYLQHHGILTFIAGIALFQATSPVHALDFTPNARIYQLPQSGPPTYNATSPLNPRLTKFGNLTLLPFDPPVTPWSSREVHPAFGTPWRASYTWSLPTVPPLEGQRRLCMFSASSDTLFMDNIATQHPEQRTIIRNKSPIGFSWRLDLESPPIADFWATVTARFAHIHSMILNRCRNMNVAVELSPANQDPPQWFPLMYFTMAIAPSPPPAPDHWPTEEAFPQIFDIPGIENGEIHFESWGRKEFGDAVFTKVLLRLIDDIINPLTHERPELRFQARLYSFKTHLYMTMRFRSYSEPRLTNAKALAAFRCLRGHIAQKGATARDITVFEGEKPLANLDIHWHV